MKKAKFNLCEETMYDASGKEEKKITSSPVLKDVSFTMPDNLKASTEQPSEMLPPTTERTAELLKLIALRRKSMGHTVKVKGKRGRKPKEISIDDPENESQDSQDTDDTFLFENDSNKIQYDTGLSIKNKQEDGLFLLDRDEDYDKELNFER